METIKKDTICLFEGGIYHCQSEIDKKSGDLQ